MNKETLDKIDALREEMRDIVDKCEAEKRTLNEEEIALFEAKETEIRSLQVTENKENNIQIEKRENMFYQDLANKLQAIANNRSVEGMENVAGNAIELRAASTASTIAMSGNVQNIQSEYATELIEPLQANLLVDKVGVKVITTGKAVVLPSVNNVEASIEGENTELVGKKLSFAKTKIETKRVGLSLPFSNTAIKEADINLTSYAINLCGKAEAQLINKVMFSGATTNGVTGPFVAAISGATAVSAATVTYADLVGLNGAVKQANVPVDATAAYVVSPAVAAVLKTTPKNSGATTGFIMEDGKIDGYPVLESSDVNGYIGFGVFSNVMIQKVDTPTIVVDNLSRSRENITEINFNDNIAIQVIRTEAFAAIALAD